MPPTPSSVSPRRRLTPAQRVEIARERAKGVPSRALATRFGVSVQTVTAAVRSLRDAPAVEGQGTRVLGLRVTTQEARAFEAAIGRLGISKTEALRRLMHAASDVLAPDEELADRLRRYGAEVNRVGGNLNQLARACNEARLMGQPIPYTARSHAEVRAAIRAEFDTAAHVGQLARDRRGRLDAVVAEALGAGGDDEPT